MRWGEEDALQSNQSLLHLPTVPLTPVTVPSCTAHVCLLQIACASSSSSSAMSFFGSSVSRKSHYNKCDEAGVSREERMNRLKFELREHIRFLAGQTHARSNTHKQVHRARSARIATRDYQPTHRCLDDVRLIVDRRRVCRL